MNAVIPKPPSLNHIYQTRVFKGQSMTYMTKAGREWFKQAGQFLPAFEPILEPVQVAIHLYTARHQDADNIVKPVFDLLTKSGVIGDDYQISHFSVERIHVPHLTEERVEVEWSPSKPSLTVVTEDEEIVYPRKEKK